MAQAKRGAGPPSFPGKALRDVPVPAAEVWVDDEFGKAVLNEYNERVRVDFDENPFLRVFQVAGGIVHGSNPFATCLVDMIVRPSLRVATPPDLHAVLVAQRKASTLVNIRGGYNDAGLVLRSVKEPNSYIAQNFVEQLDPKMAWPVVIYLSGLQLVKDPKSPCHLSFRLTRESHAFSAPIMDEKSGHFDDAHVDGATGLPTQLGGTGRYFYSTEEGLARLYLGRGSSLDTIWDELGNSQADGRVCLVKNDVPPDKVSEYLRLVDVATDLLER